MKPKDSYYLHFKIRCSNADNKSEVKVARKWRKHRSLADNIPFWLAFFAGLSGIVWEIREVLASYSWGTITAEEMQVAIVEMAPASGIMFISVFALTYFIVSWFFN